MLRSRTAALLRTCIAAAAALTICAVAAPPALAHGDGPDCVGFLARYNNIYEGNCQLPFQGYPIGVSGVYIPGTAPNGSTRPSSIHVTVTLHSALGEAFDQSLSIECYDPEPGPDGNQSQNIFTTTRCTKEENDPATGSEFTLVEAIPADVVSISCTAHSHARWGVNDPVMPFGEFACWSSADGRDDLQTDGVIDSDNYVIPQQ